MNESKYWEREFPQVKILGRTRIAHYAKAGVLQFSVLHQAADGSLEIGKTVCLFEESVSRENLPAIEFLMDVLHMWRKRGRCKNPNERHNQLTRKHIALDELQELVNSEKSGRGDLTAGPVAILGSVDTSQDEAGTVAQGVGVDTPAMNAGPVPLNALDSAEATEESSKEGEQHR